VSANGEWSEWIEFCLRGAIEQARDAVDRCKLLWAIRERCVKRAMSISNTRTVQTIDAFFKSPVIRPGDIQKRFGVQYNTAKSDINNLFKIGILRRFKTLRPASYYAWEFFSVTYQDHPRMATEEEIKMEVERNLNSTSLPSSQNPAIPPE